MVTHCGLRFLTVEAPPGAARPPLGDFPTLVAEAGPGILENSRIIFFEIFYVKRLSLVYSQYNGQ